MTTDFSNLIGSKIEIPGHFARPVTIEAVKPVGDTAKRESRRIRRESSARALRAEPQDEASDEP